MIRGVDGAYVLEANTQSVDHAGAVALDQHIRFRGQVEEGGPAPGALEIDLDPLQAAPRSIAVKGRLDLFCTLLQCGTHLYDTRPVVGEVSRRARSGAHAREIEHGDAFELGGDVGHESRPAVSKALAQKFFGRPSVRREMMFFWISDAPPPMVSITV